MTDEHLDRMVRAADPYRPDLPGRLDGADRALLEEIMAVPSATSRPPSGHRRALLRRAAGALAAAAAVTAVIAVSATFRDQPAVPPGASGRSTGTGLSTEAAAMFPAAVLKAAEDNPRLLIDEPGWTATDVVGFAELTGSIRFAKGGRDLEMNWYPAQQYRSFRRDRLSVSPPEPAQVAGAQADVFVYNASDFAAMLPPRGKSFVELRTGGAWNRGSFDAILAEIVRADVPTWLAALPDTIVTPDRVATEAKRVLADVPLPPGFSVASLADLGTNDAYQFGAGVTGRVGCAWIAEWSRAKKAGDDAALRKAADALRSSRRWKVLKDMEAGGGWSEVFWETAEEVADGRPSPGYAGSIGCRR
jgi:hypothetical protein